MSISIDEIIQTCQIDKAELISFATVENIDQINSYVKEQIIPFTATDYSEHILTLDDVNEFDELKNMFIKQGINILQNLVKIFESNDGFFQINMANVWFAGEPTFYKLDKDVVNPFLDNPIMSNILTIIVKLIDYINDLYIRKIEIYVEEIIRCRQIIDMYPMDSLIIQSRLELFRREYDKIALDIRMINTISKSIELYFLNMFKHINQTKNYDYLYFLPISILNIFNQYKYISMDPNVLTFMVEYNEWVPIQFREESLDHIAKIKYSHFFDLQVIITQFQPNIELVINDFIAMYKKYLLDSMFVENICKTMDRLFGHIIYDVKSLKLIDTDKLIHFTSICITLSVKMLEIKDMVPPRFYDDYVNNFLCCIELVLKNTDALNSYLIYQIPTVLNEFYKVEFDSIQIHQTVDRIFRQILTNELATIYIAGFFNSVEELNESKIPMDEEHRAQILKWIQNYKKISDSPDQDSITDPLTSATIIVPCLVPLNADSSLVQHCDKNMLYSYLWTKPENPFTRQSLTIQEVDKFNSLDINIDKIVSIVGTVNKIIEN
jgi:hypothetical protein